MPRAIHFPCLALTALTLAAALITQPCLGVAYAATKAAAQEAGVEYVAGVGFIDWENAKAVASGTGAPPAQAANAAQARAAARRAAVLDARRNLLEVVGQVRIDSQTIVRNLLVQNDVVTSRVRGVLKQSSIMAEQTLADGSVRVTVSVPLTGALTRELLMPGQQAPPSGPNRITPLEGRVRMLEAQVAALTNALEQLANKPPASPATASPLEAVQTRRELTDLDARLRHLENSQSQQPQQTRVTASAQRPTAPPLPPAIQAEARVATGLIIDARGTGFKPTLRPSIISGDKQLYPSDTINFEQGVRQGFVRYYRDLAQAQQSNRAGTTPKIIRAESIEGKLQITPTDADFLQNILADSDNFLDRCQVVVVF